MEYTIISGDSHVDLTWLPGDLFASNAPADMAAKMPRVVEDEKGKSWRANGIELGGVGGLGFTGEKVEQGLVKAAGPDDLAGFLTRTGRRVCFIPPPRS